MQEFSSVTASSYDADSLAPMLAEKSAEGWSVISIVAAGTNIVAYLEREADGSTAEAEDAAGSDSAIATEVEEESRVDRRRDPVVPGRGGAVGRRRARRGRARRVGRRSGVRHHR